MGGGRSASGPAPARWGALALTADGVDADATLALQYMTDDTGSWPSDLANGLAPLLAFAAFAAVLLFGLRARCR